MREAHEREREVGIEWYVSDSEGVRGQLRSEPADFRVREVETVSPEPVGADEGAYPHLLVRVRLREWDTNDFARAVANRLGIGRERVSWAGTKDKHAVTTQLFSLRGVDPDRLPTLEDAEIDVVGRIGRSLQFGDLAGNAFEIRVRAESDDESAAVVSDLSRWTRAVESGEGDETETRSGRRRSASTALGGAARLGDGGQRAGTLVDDEAERTAVTVPNWFGHQRFGSRRPVTHEVGLRLVAGDPRGAVLAYVGNPSETEPASSRAAREVVEREAESDDPDWAAALDAMPSRLRFERSMLHRLVDPSAAEPPAWLDEVAAESPAQPGEGVADDSRWWHALAAVPENLQRLFVNAAQSFLFNRILSERLSRGLPFDRPVEGDVVCFRASSSGGTTDSHTAVTPDPDRTQRATADRVAVLQRHCERCRAFVTAPLIGYETTLADGVPGEIERDVLEAAGVEPEDFALPGPFDSTGTRRAVLVGTELAVECVAGDPVFAFGLPSGAYATALLREFLKTDPVAL
ncbi:MAG: tRNA pseudouridine(13) synthase TruD [Halobaculum sp.]